MKVWKIPAKYKKRLEEKRREAKRRWDAWEKGWDLIEKLTGLKPKLRPLHSLFAFLPEKAGEIAKPPEGLRWKRIPDYGSMMVPDLRTKKGKEMWTAWDQAGIEPAEYGLELVDALFGGLGKSTKKRFRVRVDTIGGVEYLVEADGFEPEKFGYQPVEV